MLHRVDVVQREIGHVTVIVDRCDDRRIVGGFYRQRRTAVKRLVEGNDFGTSVMERSQFQSVLIGFRATVDKKQAVVLVAGDFSQSFGYLLLQLVDDGV